VLLDLAAHAIESQHGIVVTASYRDIGRRVGLSKDTVGRRIDVLRRAGVVVDQFGHSASRFEIRDYLLRLDVVGFELDLASPQT
jgi:DNA-binding transcriptional ArsR family regulator